jgi:hypothetical protein
MSYSELQPLADLAALQPLADDGQFPVDVLADIESPTAQRNPCAALDEKSKVSISHDAYHIDGNHGCSQICMPNALHFVAKMHGVSYGGSCLQKGFTTAADDGWDHGIHFFNYIDGTGF